MPEVIDPKTIWQLAENRPSLIARDFKVWGIPHEVAGVFKWLAVRRDLIHAKDKWRDKITATLASGDQQRLYYLRGYLRALEECREEIRRMCHSPRWRAPDNDPAAARWLWQTQSVLLGSNIAEPEVEGCSGLKRMS